MEVWVGVRLSPSLSFSLCVSVSVCVPLCVKFPFHAERFSIGSGGSRAGSAGVKPNTVA